MKNKSTFSQILLVIIIAVLCIIATVTLALLAGSMGDTLFDFRNLNIANMLPVLLIGGFVTCVVVGISVLIISRAVFFKVRDYLNNLNDDGGNEK